MQTVDYFHLIIFGCLILLIITASWIIVKLASRVTELHFELKLSKTIYQKDLDRLEDKINMFSNQSNSNKTKYSKDIERLDGIVKTLNTEVDNKIDKKTI